MAWASEAVASASPSLSLSPETTAWQNDDNALGRERALHLVLVPTPTRMLVRLLGENDGYAAPGEGIMFMKLNIKEEKMIRKG